MARLMNNSAAIYVAYDDHTVVAGAIADWMQAAGYRRAAHSPAAMSGRIMLPDKPRRLFFVLPTSGGWVAVWEDPRYFADRELARYLARHLATRTIWLEVSGNAVGWARGVYDGEAVEEEHYDETETTFYGEYGSIRFVYDIETTPAEFIARYVLPYDELYYEAVLAGELPVEAGTPIHLAFDR